MGSSSSKKKTIAASEATTFSGIDTPAGSVALQKVMELLVAGTFTSGEPVREVRIAEQLGINRNAVREALNQLVGMDVMEYIPYCGYRLLPYTLRDMLEWHELRLCIEPMAVRLSDGRPYMALKPLHDELEEILAIEEQCTAKNDQQGCWRCDISFHLKLVECSGNRRMSGVFLRGSLLALASRNTVSIAFPDGRADTTPGIVSDPNRLHPNLNTHVFHKQIFDEVTHGTRDEAARLLTCHIELIYKRIRGFMMSQVLQQYPSRQSMTPIRPVVTNLLDGYRK